ncbi:hypothetical protein Nepgr_019630 [Nepenthes gracilis]|uniref:Uncharacterized protein n=1 Tax=Nepenthes gracilis TaxID=150966 RepID=A0AAD3XV85_NEPGR|nr:hypothetical protein Nepgr_019630 [Nepenthes gracilis]
MVPPHLETKNHHRITSSCWNPWRAVPDDLKSYRLEKRAETRQEWNMNTKLHTMYVGHATEGYKSVFHVGGRGGSPSSSDTLVNVLDHCCSGCSTTSVLVVGDFLSHAIPNLDCILTLDY